LGKHRPRWRRMGSPTPFFQSLIKRGFDIVAATICLLLLSPFILLVSLGIRLESTGTILCRHKRYNTNNIEFEIFQFRTTRVDQWGNALNRGPNEMQCVTGSGQVLHHSGANKLPLLINVLRGEISVVGSHLFTTPPGEAFPPLPLQAVKPGVISWAQVTKESTDTAQDTYRCIKCDGYYVGHCSLLFDLKILLLAIWSDLFIRQDR
jgi:lipopolysaccharide/colanic/teichoic acid biosynthesis glycosyltransferase